MIRWMIMSTLATGLFYALYLWLFRRDRWFDLSRAYLFIILGFCSLFPWFQLPASVMSSTPATEFLMTVDNPETYVVGNIPMEEPELSLKLDIIPSIYFGGVALMLAILIIQLTAQAVRIRRLRREYPVYGWANGFEIPKGALLILVPDNTEPYSFFKNIIVGTRDLDEEEMRCILAHESEHVSRNHSLDIVCMRLVCCVMWFNPFAWMMLHELRSVHEYQADAAVADGDNKDYLRLLYRQTTGFGYGHITNKFHSINLKKRITMMKRKKTRFGAWKTLAALPVAALLMTVGCQNAPVSILTDTVATYDIPDGTYRNGDRVDVFSDGVLMSRTIRGIEVPPEQYGEMEIFHGEVLTNGSLERFKELHEKYKYIRLDRMDITENDVPTVYMELCYSNDSTCWLAWIEKDNAKSAPVAEEQEEALLDPIEDEPQFPGGLDALMKYLSKNIRYPEQAKKDNIQGKVYVTFVVEKDGSINGAKILRGVGGGCDEEALRVVNAMPKWEPGKLQGKPVRVQYNLPIVFKLQ